MSSHGSTIPLIYTQSVLMSAAIRARRYRDRILHCRDRTRPTYGRRSSECEHSSMVFYRNGRFQQDFVRVKQTLMVLRTGIRLEIRPDGSD